MYYLTNQPEKEASLLFRYLTGSNITQAQMALYKEGVEKLLLDLNDCEKEILEAAGGSIWMLRMCDFGLVKFLPASHLRRRFLLMASVAECNPEHVHLFLNPVRNKWAWLTIGWMGCKWAGLYVGSFIIFTAKGWR